MNENNYKIILDDLGYLRLDPIPQTADYYRKGYHESAGMNRAPDIRRAIDGGREYEKEKFWLSATLWEDIREIGILCLRQWVKGYHFLDFGCGVGDFCQYMQGFGWSANGVELSEYARKIATENGIKVYESLSQINTIITRGYDIISAINVLEHVPNPKETIEELKSHLSPGGVLAIQVPNDFSQLQEIVKTKAMGREYWVSSPDHINYFNFDSLTSLLQKCGMEVVYRMSTFPMEWFVLLGDNYVLNPEFGNGCHNRRMNFDLSLPTDIRRAFYAKLAEIGWGRHCVVFAVDEKSTMPNMRPPFTWMRDTITEGIQKGRPVEITIPRP